MKRGDVVLVAPPGEFGKPRPAVIIQSDFAFPSGYFTYLPITSDLLRIPNIRVSVNPSEQNGLRQPSEIMVDMIQTSSRSRFGGVIGILEAEALGMAEVALLIHLGLGSE